MRTRREEWRKRVTRWKDSGLTAQEYAAEAGLNPRTLTWWRSAFEREARGQSARSAKEERIRAVNLVELKPPVAVAPAPSALIEIDLDGRRKLRFSETTAPEVVARLIAALEARA
jgi:hypothetical protein